MILTLMFGFNALAIGLALYTGLGMLHALVWRYLDGPSDGPTTRLQVMLWPGLLALRLLMYYFSTE